MPLTKYTVEIEVTERFAVDVEVVAESEDDARDLLCEAEQEIAYEADREFKWRTVSVNRWISEEECPDSDEAKVLVNGFVVESRPARR